MKYPFFRKYPNNYLQFLGLYPFDELKDNGIFRMFELSEVKNIKQEGYLFKKAVIIKPKKENSKWREAFRSINKPLSFNY